MDSEETTWNQSTGQRGEDLACQYYSSRGYDIVARNARVARIGEIDAIASCLLDGVLTYVFIEVKTRSSARYGEGFEAISFNKRMRMRTCALSWLADNTADIRVRYSWRLDVVSILMDGQEPRFTVLENVEV